MLGPLRKRHALILMDYRGTGGSGAIDCPRLQAGLGNYVREVGRCARKLADRTDAYGTGAAADDLAAVLDRLKVPVVDIYGDSYGTYFAQTFAVRHPERVRAVVLDAAFSVDRLRPVGARAARGSARRLAVHLRALGRLQGRSARRAGRPRAAAGAATTRGQGPRCRRHSSPGPRRWPGDRADERRRELLQLDLPRPARGRTRVRAWRPASAAATRRRELWPATRPAGIPRTTPKAPTRRSTATTTRPLAAVGGFRGAASGAGGRPRAAGAGHLRAVPGRPLARHRARARAGVRLPPVARTEGRAIPRCRPARASRRCPCSCSTATSTRSRLRATPRPRRRCSRIRDSCVVRNVGHVTALSDFDRCGAVLVRRFLTDLDPGDTSCAERIPELHVVPKFPRRAADAPAAELGARRPLERAGSPRRLDGRPQRRRRLVALVAHVRGEGPRPARRKLHVGRRRLRLLRPGAPEAEEGALREGPGGER